MDIETLLKTAFEDLQKVSDPYQHGMLAMAIAAQIRKTPVLEREDLVNKPEMKEEKKETPAIKAMTPASEKIASVANEAAKKTEEPEIEVTMTPAEPAPETQKKDDPAYYDTDEWKNKHLSSNEMDATWTDRMKKNLPLMNDASTLKSFVQFCAKNDMMHWLDQTISNVTDNHFTSASDTRIYMPKMVSFILPALKKAYYDLQQQTNKAA